ncbi:enoyl-CoA hydratase/isomerase family protein [bacterium]|nr:enoyl-CoA hydratase/isomerase family protein [FCB group bacterium]MBL7190259.1 enoyl-CoA hydratase/isomerase family protein [bacterium]
MKKYQTLLVDIDNKIARVTLNRPEIHNAFNEVMLSELLEVCTELAEDKSVRVMVLTGAGKSFCAGADLHWMKKMISFSYEENFADAMVLANAMNALYSMPQPVIAKVNGSAIGGGMGLVTACDIALAAEHAKFSLSEVKIGLVPACIAPYVIRKAGPGPCREFFLTGERLTARRAKEGGLINNYYPAEKLDEEVEALVERLITSGPNALAYAKQLIDKIPGMNWETAKRFTADMIAQLRIGPEGQEGCAAFLEKRSPEWVDKKK